MHRAGWRQGSRRNGPGAPCACTVHTGSVLSTGGQFPGGSRRGREVIYQVAVHTPVSTCLPLCACHVPRHMLQICMLISEIFVSYLMPVPPFKCYYSMYYSYLSHCPKAFERPSLRWRLGHLCGYFFSLYSNHKQLLVHCLWALRTSDFLPFPVSPTLSFFSYLPALLLSGVLHWGLSLFAGCTGSHYQTVSNA